MTEARARRGRGRSDENRLLQPPPRQDGRTAMGRASDARPQKFYVASERAARQEPPEVTAARERYRAYEAELDAMAAERYRACTGEVMPDAAPGYEWHRELAELAEVTAARDRYQDALAAVPEPGPAPAPPPVTAASRCRRCGYLTTAAGHRVICDE